MKFASAPLILNGRLLDVIRVQFDLSPIAQKQNQLRNDLVQAQRVVMVTPGRGHRSWI